MQKALGNIEFSKFLFYHKNPFEEKHRKDNHDYNHST